MLNAGVFDTQFVIIDRAGLPDCLVSGFPQFFGNGMVAPVPLIPMHLIKDAGFPLVDQGGVDPPWVPVGVIVGAHVMNHRAGFELERHVRSAK
ncbi:MAG: hypothetical protein DWQ21_03460 [Bacteroidetes bacterium]|nr:MAG: hypothetical protein DWQ21_03460 [Bacteroidota bacterium]